MCSDTGRPVALVTGAANPIVAATISRLARSGTRVIACDVDCEERKEDEASGAPDQEVVTFAADLADEGEARRIVELGLKKFERLDLLVTGPALPPEISWPDGPEGGILAGGEEELRRWINCVTAALPPLERSGGKIVSVVTSAGRYRTGYFRPETTTRSATPEALVNGAILGLIRQLALELAPKHVRLNAVVVGLLEGSQEFERMSEQERKFALEEISLGRLGTPQEVAGVIAFLASNASNYVTGTAIDVNGGWWMS